MKENNGSEHAFFILGAGHGLGFTLSEELAKAGHQVIAGTRKPERFEQLKKSIQAVGGREPLPFIADITQMTQVHKAFDELWKVDTFKERKLHYLPLAAGGIEGIGRQIMEQIATVRKGARQDPDALKQLLEQATESLRVLTTSETAINEAYTINYDAPWNIFDLLFDRELLDSQSFVVNTSSSISDNFVSKEAYPGPWFYFSTAMSKKSGARELAHEAAVAGLSYRDIVAPEISDTDVAKLIEQMVKIMEPVTGVIDIPKVTRAQVVRATLKELTEQGPEDRKVYVLGDRISYAQPRQWQKPLVPYF